MNFRSDTLGRPGELVVEWSSSDFSDIRRRSYPQTADLSGSKSSFQNGVEEGLQTERRVSLLSLTCYVKIAGSTGRPSTLLFPEREKLTVQINWTWLKFRFKQIIWLKKL